MDTNYDVHMSQTHKYKNTSTQIHKYMNTAYDKVPDRPNMGHIFGKRNVQGYQKWYAKRANTQLQIHKYKYVIT